MSLKNSIIAKIEAVGGKYEMVAALERCKNYSSQKYRSDFDITIIYVNAIYGGYIDGYESCLINNKTNINLRLQRYIRINKTYRCKHLDVIIDIIESNLYHVEGLRLLSS